MKSCFEIMKVFEDLLFPHHYAIQKPKELCWGLANSVPSSIILCIIFSIIPYPFHYPIHHPLSYSEAERTLLGFSKQHTKVKLA